jgi:hypothetical protein
MKRTTTLPLMVAMVMSLAAVPASAAGFEGNFVPTGNMEVARFAHTATLLHDGKVLIAGGTTFDAARPSSLATAELYDPATGAFRPTGSMTVPRNDHTATLLPDGTVLIVGGTSLASQCCAALDTAELYDPQTEAFLPMSRMTAGRMMHSSTLLATGEVLITGGMGDSSGSGNFPDTRWQTAELYDPVTRSFRPTGPMGAERFVHTQALLPDGTVLVAGGEGRDDAPILFVERYYPDSGLFRKAGAIVGPVYSDGPAILSLLADGRVLMVLEAYGRQPTTAACLYDPVTLQFQSAGSLHGARFLPQSTLLRNGRVLVTGVAGGFDKPAAEIYDPNTGEFSAEGPMVHRRLRHTGTLLADGSVLIAGGWKERYGGEVLASAELYQPEPVVDVTSDALKERIQ